jgi:FKBP-type peptidyl-prolyl cis-trans isomerase FkpA/FKBP-type peptidyl-prolyl cis-trans isomerase FklB
MLRGVAILVGVLGIFAVILSFSQAQEPKAEQKAWLEENAQREGVKTTQSGLQYRIVEPGSDTKPAPSDTVRVHYEGRLIDGTVFDSSYERGQPVEFPLNRVIPGWTEGLQLIGEGGKIELFIPSELGYGARGTPGGPIPPHATLIFDVELLEVTSAN